MSGVVQKFCDDLKNDHRAIKLFTDLHQISIKTHIFNFPLVTLFRWTKNFCDSPLG